MQQIEEGEEYTSNAYGGSNAYVIYPSNSDKKTRNLLEKSKKTSISKARKKKLEKKQAKRKEEDCREKLIHELGVFKLDNLQKMKITSITAVSSKI